MSTLEVGLPELLGTPTVSDLGLNPILQSGTGFGSDVADFGPDEMGDEPGLEQELVSLGYTPEQIERVIDYYGAKIQEAIDDNQWIECQPGFCTREHLKWLKQHPIGNLITDGADV
ncbi:MAG: hypothetical protein ACRC10_06515 [Thermoguttaceae bacterium]